ncbi:hypothetical protein D9M72_576130 [compost metagenome]
MPLYERAGFRVHQRQARLHMVEIELGAAEVRVGLDAAIGDRKQASVGSKRHVVGTDAIGRDFADAGEVVGAVIDADHAAIVGKVILRGVEQLAIR